MQSEKASLSAGRLSDKIEEAVKSQRKTVEESIIESINKHKVAALTLLLADMTKHLDYPNSDYERGRLDTIEEVVVKLKECFEYKQKSPWE